MMSDYDFVKTIFSWGLDIKPYVVYKAITEAEYKEITGVDYVADTTEKEETPTA